MAENAAEQTRTHAEQVRMVLAECHRILHDPTESQERRDVARRWEDRLLHAELGNGWSGYSMWGGGAGLQRHKRSGGLTLNQSMRYDGYADD